MIYLGVKNVNKILARYIQVPSYVVFPYGVVIFDIKSTLFLQFYLAPTPFAFIKLFSAQYSGGSIEKVR
jgi:hypothetical protein